MWALTSFRLIIAKWQLNYQKAAGFKTATCCIPLCIWLPQAIFNFQFFIFFRNTHLIGGGWARGPDHAPPFGLRDGAKIENDTPQRG